MLAGGRRRRTERRIETREGGHRERKRRLLPPSLTSFSLRRPPPRFRRGREQGRGSGGGARDLKAKCKEAGVSRHFSSSSASEQRLKEWGRRDGNSIIQGFMKKATFCFRPFSPLLAETRKFRCCEHFFSHLWLRPALLRKEGDFSKKLHFVLICQLPCGSCTACVWVFIWRENVRKTYEDPKSTSGVV